MATNEFENNNPILQQSENAPEERPREETQATATDAPKAAELPLTAERDTPPQGDETWAIRQANNAILREKVTREALRQGKKKRDPVKWAAFALAGVFALTTAFSAAALNKVKLGGSTITGTVIAVEGNAITVSVSSAESRGNFGKQAGAMFGNQTQGTPPDLQGEQNAPTRGQEDSEQSESDTRSQEDARQQMPEGEPGQRQGDIPDMQGGFGSPDQGMSEGGSGEITVKLGAGTTIINGSRQADISSIEVGDTVTITFGAWNSVKSVNVSENAGYAFEGFGNSFGAVPNGGEETEQQSDEENSRTSQL